MFSKIISKSSLKLSTTITRTLPIRILGCETRNWDVKSATQRTIFLGNVYNDKLATKHVQKHDWNRAVSEAEKIVGYPTSFLSLRWLLSDEIANVALHLRKLVGSNHPLLKIARNLLYNGKNSMQAWGLIVLLISKAAGHAPSIPDMEQDKSAGVLHSQRALAEVTEMIRISHLVHQSLVNLQPQTQAGNDKASLDDMTFGNKISLLSGDYLLGQSCSELANLRNQELVELISTAVRDFTESEFIGDRDEQNNPLPSKPKQQQKNTSNDNEVDFNHNDLLEPLNIENIMGIPEKEWEVRNILCAASLLGKSCQGALKLAGQPEEIQLWGYQFGKHLSLAWQAGVDAEPFQNSTLPFGGTFSLVSAPVLFHLEYDPSFYEEIEKGKVSIENVNYEKIHNEIIRGPALEKTKNLQKKHLDAALKVLEKFPPSDARTALQNIILAMQDLCGTFSLVSAPVLFHLEYDPSFYEEIEKGKVSIENVNYEKIHNEIIRGPALEKTKNLQKKHLDAALKVLEKFPPSDARTALQNIILAMQDL